MSGKLQQIVQHYREQLLAREYDAAQTLEHAYQHTLSMIQPRLDALYKEIQGYIDRDEPVPPEFLYERQRLKVLQQFISGQVSQYGVLAQLTTQHLQQAGVQMGQASALQMLHDSLPVGVQFSFGVPSPKAIADLVGATQKGSPLYDLFAGFGPEAAKNVGNALITGLSLGDNPRVVADSVMQALQVPRYRALTIARDQMLNSYRSAALETYRANSDVVEGWIWVCAMTPRSCVACIMMNGQEFSLDQDLDDHVCGRCARAPKTKDWGDILSGLDIDTSDIEDTRPTFQSGESWFNEQSEDTQRSILGNAGYDLWADDSNDVSLSDFVGHDHDADWGRSIYVKSVKQLQKGN